MSVMFGLRSGGVSLAVVFILLTAPGSVSPVTFKEVSGRSINVIPLIILPSVLKDKVCEALAKV